MNAFGSPARAGARAGLIEAVEEVRGQMCIATQLDFGQFSSAARDAEHRITLNNLVSALEHELHAAEVPECRPPPFDA